MSYMMTSVDITKQKNKSLNEASDRDSNNHEHVATKESGNPSCGVNKGSSEVLFAGTLITVGSEMVAGKPLDR
jgi:hypothetical protein